MDYSVIGGITQSRLALGCMRIADKPIENTDRLVRAALDIGVNVLDNADIYGGGTCEEIIGKLFASDKTLRDKIVLQTKCGIRGGWYDSSYEHIIESVERSLKRLNTDRIDVLLLHRPDALMRPERIARAFDELHSSGKVLAFGVSNYSAQQIDFLQSYVNQRLCVNQLQLSAAYCPVIDYGINVNTQNAVDRDGGVMEYCRKNGITIQTYGTMQYAPEDGNGLYGGVFTSESGKEKFFALNFTLEGLAKKYDTTVDAVAVAWVLHHPANMQAIVGTTSDWRIRKYKDCCDVPLTDYEWYKIYESAGHKLP